ncbi:MAG: DUF3034 family protein [Kiritimatiellia bacterium]
MNRNISIILATTALAAATARAGVPLNNLQGVGGIAFNPLAYTAGQPWEGGGTNALNGIVSKPQVGLWYVGLSDADIGWFAAGAAITFADRLELSYGYGFTDAKKYGDKSIDSNNFGAKLRILDENAFGTAWVPAVAVGTVYKHTNTSLAGDFALDKGGFDYYVVASKLVRETPIPVLLSAGVLCSDEVVNGVIGHGHYDVSYFGNIDVLPSDNVAIGFEYKSGIDADTSGISNHDYYDGHVAWFVTPQLTLVGAYAYTGDKDRFYRDGHARDLGFGGGFVLSAQYQF